MAVAIAALTDTGSPGIFPVPNLANPALRMCVYSNINL